MAETIQIVLPRGGCAEGSSDLWALLPALGEMGPMQSALVDRQGVPRAFQSGRGNWPSLGVYEDEH